METGASVVTTGYLIYRKRHVCAFAACSDDGLKCVWLFWYMLCMHEVWIT